MLPGYGHGVSVLNARRPDLILCDLSESPHGSLYRMPGRHQEQSERVYGSVGYMQPSVPLPLYLDGVLEAAGVSTR